MVYYFPAGKRGVERTFSLGDGLYVRTGTRIGDEVTLINPLRLSSLSFSHPREPVDYSRAYDHLKVWSEDS